MAKPVAVVGLTDLPFTERIMHIRREIRSNGYDTGEPYTDTLPHLSLAWNPVFETKATVSVMHEVAGILGGLEEFQMPLKGLTVFEGKTVAVFENALTMMLAVRVADALSRSGFDPVLTDHIAVVRSRVLPGRIHDVMDIIVRDLPKKFTITRVVLADNLLREADILWSIPPQEIRGSVNGYFSRFTPPE